MHTPPSPLTLADQIAVTPTNPTTKDEYISTFLPGRMGNTQPIAYGGCTLGIGVNAAYQTVKEGYHLYSLLGNYLGPTRVDRKVYAKVTRVRDTRTFATRMVELRQRLDEGGENGVGADEGAEWRSCAIMIADFHTQERESLLEYTSPPQRTWPGIEQTVPMGEVGKRLVKEGKASPEMVNAHATSFRLGEMFLETRVPAEESMMASTFIGMLPKSLPNTQDSLPLPERVSAQWTRARHALSSEGLQMGALAFYLDGALSFVPLTHSKMGLMDAGACSTLDFAIRILKNGIDFTDWTFKEMKTVAGAEGRTFSEARLWDREGVLVATMSQQNILRPKKVKKEKASL